jgi:hypothetical protein
VIDPDTMNTRFGFIWKDLHVERISVNKSGQYLFLSSKTESMEIRITPGGKISVQDHFKNKKAKKGATVSIEYKGHDSTAPTPRTRQHRK